MKATKQSHDWHCHNHDTYGWRGEECKQCKVAPFEVEQLVFRNERLAADYALLQEENNALRRIHAENLVIKDAEIARLKNVPMKYRRMEFNAQLQAENASLRAEVERLNAVIESNIDEGINKIMLMSDEQISALAGFEGRSTEDQETIARQCFEIAEQRVDHMKLVEENHELRQQLAALKTELREICAAIDDPACDLTLTTVECVKKLKADNEWRDIETAPKDNAVFLAWRKHATHPLMVRYEPSYDWFANYDGEHVYDLTHWMPLPKSPAMAQGENNV